MSRAPFHCAGIVALVAGTAGVSAWAQARVTPARGGEGLKTIEVSEPGGQILGFRHLGGTTVVQMRGTKIEPGANAELKVESRPGFLEIDFNRGAIRGLQPARRFGKDYLTYVLWAVSVDGEPANLGEITFDGNNAISINVTTPYQTFWLMITAEPDFAVNDPSPLVVMYSIHQNGVNTPAKAIPVPGKLLYHTYYTQYDTAPAPVERGGVSNELLQARKAVELASGSGVLAAPTPAGEEPLPDEERTRQTLAEARKYLQQAEEAAKTGNSSDAASFARTAAQIAENARALALGAAGGLYARQLDRELARARAEIERLKAEVARLTAENAALQKNAAEQLAACQRELEELRTRIAQLQAAHDQDQRRLAALEEQIAAMQEQLRLAQAENARLREERDKICGELNRQLNSLGQLTQQGGNMVLTLASDILFDSGSYELKPVARENLARLSALRQLLFAGANVSYEGHTDRVGEDDYNQWLSEQRALSVYRYFLEEQLTREQDPAAREAASDRLNAVKQLLAMPYAATARRGQARAEAMTRISGAIIGKGEREPVEDVPGSSERNRRVVLLFPPAQTGRASSLCEAAK